MVVQAYCRNVQMIVANPHRQYPNRTKVAWDLHQRRGANIYKDELSQPHFRPTKIRIFHTNLCQHTPRVEKVTYLSHHR
jgi:hypothetical protein